MLVIIIICYSIVKRILFVTLRRKGPELLVQAPTDVRVLVNQNKKSVSFVVLYSY